MKWYLLVLKKNAGFNGRSRRKENCMIDMFKIIFAIIAVAIDYTLGTTYGDFGYGIVYTLYALAVLIPGLAVTVRRLHDIGKSGWMILVGFIPIIGAIWLIILTVTDSQPGENEYGPNPKEAVGE